MASSATIKPDVILSAAYLAMLVNEDIVFAFDAFYNHIFWLCLDL